MNAVPDAWRHDDALGWLLPHTPGVDDAPMTATAAEAAPRATNALGIDISSFQGTSINWQEVAASGRQFVMIKATEGTSYISSALDVQYRGAIAAGLLCGLYHYGSPSTSVSPEAEADAFAVQVNRLGAIAGHMPPCLDLETGTGDLSGWAQRFITRLRAQTGCVRVLIYSNVSFMRNQVLTSNWLDANIALWVADWSSPPAQPSLLTPQVAMHQYSSAGVVSGIAGSVDLDICIWDLATLVPGAVTPPPAATPPASTPSDLTSAEDAALTACYQQFSGSPTVGSWPGWPSWPGGSGRSLTLVDLCRQADVQNVSILTQISALSAQVAALKAQLGTASPSLTAADQQAIALAVVTMLTQRLAS